MTSNCLMILNIYMYSQILCCNIWWKSVVFRENWYRYEQTNCEFPDRSNSSKHDWY